MSEQTFTNKNITAEINSNTIDIYDSVLNMILEVEDKYTSIDTQNLMKLRINIQ